MKLIISESRLNNVVTKWLDKNYGDLTFKSNKKIPEYQFLWDTKKDEPIIFYNGKHDIAQISDSTLQHDLIELFNVNPDSLNDILIPWIKERYDIDVNEVKYIKHHCWECDGSHYTNYHIED
jgi:hypothetical protein